MAHGQSSPLHQRAPCQAGRLGRSVCERRPGLTLRNAFPRQGRIPLAPNARPIPPPAADRFGGKGIKPSKETNRTSEAIRSMGQTSGGKSWRDSQHDRSNGGEMHARWSSGFSRPLGCRLKPGLQRYAAGLAIFSLLAATVRISIVRREDPGAGVGNSTDGHRATVGTTPRTAPCERRSHRGVALPRRVDAVGPARATESRVSERSPSRHVHEPTRSRADRFTSRQVHTASGGQEAVRVRRGPASEPIFDRAFDPDGPVLGRQQVENGLPVTREDGPPGRAPIREPGACPARARTRDEDPEEVGHARSVAPGAVPVILLLSTSDTDLLSARASGAAWRPANPNRVTDLPVCSPTPTSSWSGSSAGAGTGRRGSAPSSRRAYRSSRSAASRRRTRR